jgi:hypothetical protein
MRRAGAIDIAALRSEVERAFAARAYPGDDRIVEQRPWDDREINDVAALLRGKQWREVTLEVLQRYPRRPFECMLYTTVEGFCYYLPAFLLVCLEPGIPAHNVADSLVFYLTPPGEWAGDGVRGKSEAIVAALSPSERCAVAHVFEFLETVWDRMGYPENSPGRALDGRWRAFDPDAASGTVTGGM